MNTAELEFLCEAYAGAKWSLSVRGSLGRVSWTLVPESSTLKILTGASAEELAANIHKELTP